jgi:hypothetical protein
MWVDREELIRRHREDLKSSDWKEFRSKVYERDGHKCQRCGKGPGVEVHAHHKQYNIDGHLWEVPLNWVVTYCKCCHNAVHGELEEYAKSILGEQALSGIRKKFGMDATKYDEEIEDMMREVDAAYLQILIDEHRERLADSGGLVDNDGNPIEI